MEVDGVVLKVVVGSFESDARGAVCPVCYFEALNGHVISIDLKACRIRGHYDHTFPLRDDLQIILGDGHRFGVSARIHKDPAALRCSVDGIPKKDLRKILRRIKSLAGDPRPPGGEKLTGQNRYRVRQGRYRIVYAVQEEEHTAIVMKVGRRKDV